MEFIVLGLFVLTLSMAAIVPAFFAARKKARLIIILIPSFGLLLLSIILSLLSRLPLEPGSWNDLVFILYALISFYAFIVSLFIALALNWYFKHKKM